MRIIQSRTFEKRVRRFQKQEKKILDQQVRKSAEAPSIGQDKRGELHGVFVHKFKIHSTQYLLSYRMAELLAQRPDCPAIGRRCTARSD